MGWNTHMMTLAHRRPPRKGAAYLNTAVSWAMTPWQQYVSVLSTFSFLLEIGLLDLTVVEELH